MISRSLDVPDDQVFLQPEVVRASSEQEVGDGGRDLTVEGLGTLEGHAFDDGRHTPVFIQNNKNLICQFNRLVGYKIIFKASVLLSILISWWWCDKLIKFTRGLLIHGVIVEGLFEFEVIDEVSVARIGPLDQVCQEGVAESESGRRQLVEDVRVHVFVVQRVRHVPRVHRVVSGNNCRKFGNNK